MTPDKKQILEKALEMWHEQHAREGDPSFASTPEYSELAESGFVSSAVSELMRSSDTISPEWKSYAEKFEKEPKSENFEKKLEATEVPFDVGLACDSGFFISGTSQSGKTNLGKCIVQKLICHGITCYVLDPSRAWTHDTPTRKIVEVKTDRREYQWEGNTTFDISTLSARQKLLFVDTFCHDLYASHVAGCTAKEFVIFEECQLYVPQGSMRLAVRRPSPCENVLSLITTGANFNLRFGVVAQFSALVDKAAVKICGQKYIGSTWEPNDVSYLKGFLGKDWAAKLKTLNKGEFVYCCKGMTQLIKTPIFEPSIAPKAQFNFACQYTPICFNK
jgi:hypothetical protein